jgi:uncharacterized repeat protein (TIGR01451 family)
VTIEFRRWLGVENNYCDHAYLAVSTNGTTWVTLWQNGDTSMNDASWTLQTYNLTAVANRCPTVYVRWGMGSTDYSETYCGWNLDDIVFKGVDVVKVADLAVTQTTAPTLVFTTNTLTFTLAVTNAGPFTGTVCRVTDTLPTNLMTFASVTSSAPSPPTWGTWSAERSPP